MHCACPPFRPLVHWGRLSQARRLCQDQPPGPMSRPDHIHLTANRTRAPQIMDAQILTIQRLSPSIQGFTLGVTNPGSGFKAGQWVDFMVPGCEQVGGFSMTSSPEKLVRESHLDLAVKASTREPARWLNERAQIGDSVRMRVGGDFYYPHPTSARTLSRPHRLLLIGGGVGINPLMSILNHIQDQATSSRPEKVHLLYSARLPEELIFREEMAAITSQPFGIHVEFFVTNPSLAEVESDCHYRRISRDDVGQITGDKPESCLAYICGPTSMIKDMEVVLLSLGVPKSQIFFESWW